MKDPSEKQAEFFRLAAETAKGPDPVLRIPPHLEDADHFYQRTQVLLFLLLQYVPPFRLQALAGEVGRMSWEQYQRETRVSPGLGPFATTLAREMFGTGPSYTPSSSGCPEATDAPCPDVPSV